MSKKEDTHKLVATAGLLLVDAMVFHEIIAASHNKVPTLSTLMSSPNLKKGLEDSWRYIIDNIDYEPVLEISLNILMNLPANPVVQKSLKSLANLAYDIASSRVLLRHDLFGRIYHNLLLGKLVKYHATYYTSIPAARLLGRLLVILPSSLNASDVPPTYNGEPLHIVDFACGSGTLLSAVYKEIDARHRIESSDIKIDEMHRYLVEKGIWGFDVLHHAIHLAATVLSLHNPIPVDDSNLFALRLGQNKYLGSINFLSSSTLGQDMMLPRATGAKEQVRIGTRKKKPESIKLPNFHICVMNPPFTRSVGGNLLFGALPKKERTVLQKHLADLLKEKQLSGIGHAGLSAVFVFVGDKYLEENGRLGLVLPRAVLSGVSWELVRKTLLEGYHIEFIITSYDTTNGWNFSENTNLSEVLIVARKDKNNKNNNYTFFVNLTKKSSNELESIYLGTQLQGLYATGKLYDVENSNASSYNLKLHGKKIGEVYSAKLDDHNIGAYNVFSQMELNRVLLFLRKGIVYLPDQGIVGNYRVTTLSKIGAEIGPDRSQVHSIFEVNKANTGTFYKAFWGFDSDITKTLTQKPNAVLEPKNAKQARALWDKRAKLLIVERARLNTYPVLSVYLSEDVLSNVFWPVKLDDDLAKMLVVWLNSTFGILQLLSIAEVTCGPWVEFKKGYLQELPILNISKLNHTAKTEMIKLYEKICSMKFKPLPLEFAKPQVRKMIDEELCKILGIDANLDTLYMLLSKEPMMTG